MAESFIVEYAWLGGDELSPQVMIEVEAGVFTKLEPGTSAGHPRLSGVALPGLVNAHSHAFHRALRGMTEQAGDDFWAWREMMHRVAEGLTPETYEAMATEVYAEMARAGITCVGEFHYVHHQPDGTPYRDANEMGHALIRAARTTGIRICLLDAGYLRGGFGDEPLSPRQLRFGDRSVAEWLARVANLRDAYQQSGDVVVGIAPHSVRALSSDHLSQLAATRPDDVPVHIHLSEQPAENAGCLAAYGMTPTELLKSHGLLGPGLTAVHATHLTSGDIANLGESGTGICYCPTTERELADGIGPIDRLAEAGSEVSVGSDSHAVIDLFEEARGVELHTRLATGRRGTFAPSDLLGIASTGGSHALGFEGGWLRVGSAADFIVVDAASDRTRPMTGKHALGQIVFGATNADVNRVYVAGNRIV